MKLVTKIFLVLLIVGFPLASWYYLQTGLNYRKQALKDLAPKGKLETYDVLAQRMLKGHTTVAFYDSEISDDMTVIYDQYKSSATFQLLEFSSDSTRIADWKIISAPAEMIDSIFGDRDIILVDTQMDIRHFYNSDKSELARLVEHIAIVLPREPEPDVIVTRRNEGE